MNVESIIEDTGKAIDVVGVAAIVLGAAASFVGVVLRRAELDPYRRFRQQLGRAILLGLEFLVAADIIRTVAVAPSFRGVGVLAVVVAVRTFLSFALGVELEGRWPWQSRQMPARPSG